MAARWYDGPAGAAAIVDDDRLAQLLGKRILQYACDYVGAAPGGYGTMRVTGLVGHCAEACEVTTEAQAGQKCAKRHACVPALLSVQRAFYGTVQELAVLFTM